MAVTEGVGLNLVGVLDTLCDKACQWLATSWWFSPCCLHQWNWPLRHIWNIVKSGVKYHPSQSVVAITYNKQLVAGLWSLSQQLTYHNSIPPYRMVGVKLIALIIEIFNTFISANLSPTIIQSRQHKSEYIFLCMTY